MLTLKQFTEHINKIRVLFEKDDRFNEAMKDLTYDGYGFIYGDAIGQIVELLEILMDDCPMDKRDASWISYFIYDLDFGKEWKPGCITTKEGKDITLRTVEDLYNLLVDNMRKG